MPRTLLLTAADVRALATPSLAVEAVQSAFDAHGRGTTRMPPKVYVDLPEHDGDLRAMPAAMDGAAGVKWVNSHPHNPARHGLPSVMGLYILTDPATAQARAVLDATVLTALRTGASAAVATRHLARSDARTLGLVGAGAQAETILAAHHVLHDWDVVVADRDAERAAAVAARWGGRAGTIAEAAACDVLCTATPSRTPVVAADLVGPGTHINALGADAEGKQELDSAVLGRARVFVDDVEQASHSGEVNVPLHASAWSIDQLAGTLGGVVCGAQAGRTAAADLTLFDSTGLAVQDLALAARLVAAAEEDGVGQWIDFRAGES